MEKRVGAEARAAAGGAGTHAGTGAEGIMHGASAGMAPLPVMQTRPLCGPSWGAKVTVPSAFRIAGPLWLPPPLAL